MELPFLGPYQKYIYIYIYNMITCNDARDFSICFVENYLNRGKYSRSEREFLWNYRIKGVLNIQKTLQSG